MAEEGVSPAFARQVGERLRAVRRQQNRSLLSVEEDSGREFKASVLGAYERGERVISVLRLASLARLYDVPVDQLLPADEPQPVPKRTVPARPTPTRIDLRRLAEVDAPEAEVLERYCRMIQLQRGDFNGKVLTVRAEDVRALGRVFGRDEVAMRARLEELGLLT